MKYNSKRQERISELVRTRDAERRLMERRVKGTTKQAEGLETIVNFFSANRESFTNITKLIEANKKMAEMIPEDKIFTGLNPFSRISSQLRTEDGMRAVSGKELRKTFKSSAHRFNDLVQTTFTEYQRGVDILSARLENLAELSKQKNFPKRIQKSVETLRTGSYETNEEDFKKFLEKISGGEIQTSLSAIREYIEGASQEKVKIPKQNLRKTARENIRDLARLPRININEKLHAKMESDPFFKYALLEVSLGEVQEALDKTPADDLDGLLQYALSIEELVEETFDKINSFDDKKIYYEIQKIYDDGLLTQNEHEYVGKRISQRLSKNNILALEGRLSENEDIQIRKMMLMEHGISEENADNLAEQLTNDRFERNRNGLIGSFGEDTTNKLVKINPKLYLMGRSDLERYVSEVHSLESTSDYNPAENPERFCSFSALHRTKNELDNPASPREGEERKDELIALAERISKAGYSSRMVLEIFYGFNFGGETFRGRHKLGEDKLTTNVNRRINLSNPNYGKIFDETKQSMIKAGAIDSHRGYSLAPHSDEITEDVLRDAIEYTLNHPRAEVDIDDLPIGDEE